MSLALPILCQVTLPRIFPGPTVSVFDPEIGLTPT